MSTAGKGQAAAPLEPSSKGGENALNTERAIDHLPPNPLGNKRPLLGNIPLGIPLLQPKVIHPLGMNTLGIHPGSIRRQLNHGQDWTDWTIESGEQSYLVEPLSSFSRNLNAPTQHKLTSDVNLPSGSARSEFSDFGFSDFGVPDSGVLNSETVNHEFKNSEPVTDLQSRTAPTSLPQASDSSEFNQYITRGQGKTMPQLHYPSHQQHTAHPPVQPAVQPLSPISPKTTPSILPDKQVTSNSSTPVTSEPLDQYSEGHLPTPPQSQSQIQSESQPESQTQLSSRVAPSSSGAPPAIQHSPNPEVLNTDLNKQGHTNRPESAHPADPKRLTRNASATSQQQVRQRAANPADVSSMHSNASEIAPRSEQSPLTASNHPLHREKLSHFEHPASEDMSPLPFAPWQSSSHSFPQPSQSSLLGQPELVTQRGTPPDFLISDTETPRAQFFPAEHEVAQPQVEVEAWAESQSIDASDAQSDPSSDPSQPDQPLGHDGADILQVTDTQGAIAQSKLDPAHSQLPLAGASEPEVPGQSHSRQDYHSEPSSRAAHQLTSKSPIQQSVGDADPSISHSDVPPNFDNRAHSDSYSHSESYSQRHSEPTTQLSKALPHLPSLPSPPSRPQPSQGKSSQIEPSKADFPAEPLSKTENHSFQQPFTGDAAPDSSASASKSTEPLQSVDLATAKALLAQQTRQQSVPPIQNSNSPIQNGRFSNTTQAESPISAQPRSAEAHPISPKALNFQPQDLSTSNSEASQAIQTESAGQNLIAFDSERVPGQSSTSIKNTSLAESPSHPSIQPAISPPEGTPRVASSVSDVSDMPQPEAPVESDSTEADALIGAVPDSSEQPESGDTVSAVPIASPRFVQPKFQASKHPNQTESATAGQEPGSQNQESVIQRTMDWFKQQIGRSPHRSPDASPASPKQPAPLTSPPSSEEADAPVSKSPPQSTEQPSASVHVPQGPNHPSLTHLAESGAQFKQAPMTHGVDPTQINSSPPLSNDTLTEPTSVQPPLQQSILTDRLETVDYSTAGAPTATANPLKTTDTSETTSQAADASADASIVQSKSSDSTAPRHSTDAWIVQQLPDSQSQIDPSDHALRIDTHKSTEHTIASNVDLSAQEQTPPSRQHSTVSVGSLSESQAQLKALAESTQSEPVAALHDVRPTRHYTNSSNDVSSASSAIQRTASPSEYARTSAPPNFSPQTQNVSQTAIAQQSFTQQQTGDRSSSIDSRLTHHRQAHPLNHSGAEPQSDPAQVTVAQLLAQGQPIPQIPTSATNLSTISPLRGTPQIDRDTREPYFLEDNSSSTVQYSPDEGDVFDLVQSIHASAQPTQTSGNEPLPNLVMQKASHVSAGEPYPNMAVQDGAIAPATESIQPELTRPHASTQAKQTFPPSPSANIRPKSPQAYRPSQSEPLRPTSTDSNLVSRAAHPLNSSARSDTRSSHPSPSSRSAIQAKGVAQGTSLSSGSTPHTLGRGLHVSSPLDSPPAPLSSHPAPITDTVTPPSSAESDINAPGSTPPLPVVRIPAIQRKTMSDSMPPMREGSESYLSSPMESPIQRSLSNPLTNDFGATEANASQIERQAPNELQKRENQALEVMTKMVEREEEEEEQADDTYLELLAREIYAHVRQRIMIERERRQGGYYRGRLPW